MKISIITINLNNKTGLQKTIESVLHQTSNNYEYIIIDGASTDGSVELLEQFSEKLTYCISEPDNGVYNAMNKGIRIASGDYCLFLNSGDYLIRGDILEKLLSYSNGEDIIYGNGILETKEGELIVSEIPKNLGLEYFSTNSLHHPSTLIKKKLFKKYGLYNESNHIVSDWEFFIKAILINNVKTKKVPINISINEDSGLSRKKEYKLLLKEEVNCILNKYFPPYVLSLLKQYKEVKSENEWFRKNKIGRLLLRLRSFKTQWGKRVN